LFLARYFMPPGPQKETPATAATETGAIKSFAANDDSNATLKKGAMQ
jgi:hypothetical protein